MRTYQHLNPNDYDAFPPYSTRARIGSPDDLRDWIRRTGQHPDSEGTLTATFIVDTEGWLWVADRHSEHFACAAGRDVLSAGEMTFAVDGKRLTVFEVTNQSLGYCPEPGSWPAVERSLERVGIAHPGCFTSAMIFRLCLACGAKNIVKDEWYECSVCGSPLSRHWNFR